MLKLRKQLHGLIKSLLFDAITTQELLSIWYHCGVDIVIIYYLSGFLFCTKDTCQMQEVLELLITLINNPALSTPSFIFLYLPVLEITNLLLELGGLFVFFPLIRHENEMVYRIVDGVTN
jgi:hypothetical protein